MRFFFALLLIGGLLWWLSRRRISVTNGANAPTGTAPDASGEALGLDPGAAPGSVPTAYNPAYDRNNDPVVKIAQAAGWDSSVIPVPTVAEAVDRSNAAAAAANILLATAPTPTISQLQLDWLAAQQASVAANPYYASTGYNGDAAAVAGQVACGAQASGNAMGRVLDSSFCRGGVHYGADPQLSTGVWP